MPTEFESVMNEIVEAIKDTGYEPYDQLYGYITEGKEEYITRSCNAREKIKALNWLDIKKYVDKMHKE